MLNWDSAGDEIRRIVKDELQRLPFILSGYIGEEMQEGSPSTRIAPSASNRLQTQTGNLFRSFVPRQLGNINKISATGESLELEYGSNLVYAKIHEFGGRIRTKGKMEGFFWHKFRETKLKYYRNIALKIRHTGGVDIPARPYFRPAMERFKADKNQFGRTIAAAIIREMKKWQEKQQ